jgi:hypothetical protein
MKRSSSLYAVLVVSSLSVFLGSPAHAWSLTISGNQAASTSAPGRPGYHHEVMGDVSVTGNLVVTLPEFSTVHGQSLQIKYAKVSRLSTLM